MLKNNDGIITGSEINSIFGKGSVAVISDEAIGVLTPSLVNRCSDPCITLKLGENDFELEGTGKKSVLAALQEFEDDMPQQGNLTLNQCSRGGRASVAWKQAAEFLEKLAKAAKLRADELEVSEQAARDHERRQ